MGRRISSQNMGIQLPASHSRIQGLKGSLSAATIFALIFTLISLKSVAVFMEYV